MNKVGWMKCGTQSNSNSASLLTNDVPASERARVLVIKAAVQQLFDERHFSICDLRTIMAIVGTPREGKAFEMLRGLHCIPYAKMEPALRDLVPELVNEALLMCTDTKQVVETALHGVIGINDY